MVGLRRRIDVLSVNGRRFCTIGGLGLAADGALAVQALRARGPVLRGVLGRLGLHSYWLMAGARVLGLGRSAQRMQIVVRTPAGNQETLSADADALLVANQSTLGGRLRVSPSSRHDDGVFELCVLQSTSRLALLTTLARLAAGGTLSAGEVRIVPATWARISCDAELPFFGDGELLVRASTFELSIDARALDVIGA